MNYPALKITIASMSLVTGQTTLTERIAQLTSELTRKQKEEEEEERSAGRTQITQETITKNL